MKINNFNSDVGCDNDSLDVCDDVSSRLEQVKVDILVSDVGCDSDSLDVCDDIRSRTEQNMVEGPTDLKMW